MRDLLLSGYRRRYFASNGGSTRSPPKPIRRPTALAICRSGNESSMTRSVHVSVVAALAVLLPLVDFAAGLLA
jgi:hypothetical protein